MAMYLRSLAGFDNYSLLTVTAAPIPGTDLDAAVFELSDGTALIFTGIGIEVQNSRMTAGSLTLISRTSPSGVIETIGGDGAPLAAAIQAQTVMNQPFSMFAFIRFFLGGADTVSGSSSDDILIGGAGADAIRGLEGSDTIDYGVDSASGSGIVVNLSNVAVDAFAPHTARDGYGAIDIIAEIENAIGSLGNDMLIGDEGANSFDGRLGSDTLIGGAGADVLNGGDSFDTASFITAAAGVTANLQVGIGAGGDAQGDRYSSIEGLIGSDFNDVLVGRAGVVNRLEAGGGNDVLYGEGIDLVFGGDGTDVFFGGSGGAIEFEFGTVGIEVVWGSVENDHFYASQLLESDLVMIGGPGRDTMSGGGGDDFIYVDEFDSADGGNGNDWIVATLATAGVELAPGLSAENIWGSSLDDRLIGFSATDPTVVVGDAGDDLIIAGRAGDFVYGMAGNDRISLGWGNDNLVGGQGEDEFFYDSGIPSVVGVDVIWDFSRGSDRINLLGVFGSFDQISVQNINGHSVITSRETGPAQIWVLNTPTLDAGDIVFV